MPRVETHDVSRTRHSAISTQSAQSWHRSADAGPDHRRKDHASLAIRPAGVKALGYRRFGSKAGVNGFTELRCITVQAGPRHYPF